MIAKKYQIKVFEGMMDFVHDGGQMITEYFCPEANIAINSKSIFSCRDLDRLPDKYEIIELDESTSREIKFLALILKEKEDLENTIRRKLSIPIDK